jgi:energy-coupling factor transporter ATP-binding protein EcfA2
MTAIIEFSNVTYFYPGVRTSVFKELSFAIPEGSFTLIVGPSGSGKSTLLRCLNGLVPHFTGGTMRGRTRVADRDPLALGPRGMSDCVGFVFQDPESQFVVDRVEGELAFAMENMGLPELVMRRRIEEVLDQLNIAHLRDRSISTLSGGERQRVAIGAALTLQPEILALDEPTSQLDPQSAEEVLTHLHKLNQDLGLTIVLVEHRLERVLQYADQVLYLPGASGSPTYGTPSRSRTSWQLGLQTGDVGSPVYGTPREVMAGAELAPPLVALGKALGWEPLPLTIKEARRFVRETGGQLEPQVSGESQPPSVRSRTPAIEVQNVWFAYNGHEALRGIDLTVESGEIVALMGRNGSGKTTLLKHLVGLLRPQEGKVDLFGQDIRHRETQEIARQVGYVPQDPNALLFADTVRDEVLFTRRNQGLPVEGSPEVLRRLNLEALAGAYPRDLSAGERQRVALAAILAAEPQIILLDEPTRGMDYFQKHALAQFLREQQGLERIIVLATHDVELVAQVADRIVLLGDGEVVVDGPTREVMTGSLVFASQVNKLMRDSRFLTVEDVIEGGVKR